MPTMTWQLSPNSAAPAPDTIPPLPAPADVPAPDGADARHRAHCPMCSTEPGDAEAFIAALVEAHAPWLTLKAPAALTRRDRPRPAQLLTKRDRS
jgi:hypothetical protein